MPELEECQLIVICVYTFADLILTPLTKLFLNKVSKYSRYFRPIKEDCQSLSLSPDITATTYTRSPTTPPCTPVKIKLKKLYHLSKTTKNTKTNNGIKYVDLLTPPPKRFKLDSSPQFNIEDIEVKIPDDIRGNDINTAHLNPLTKDKAIIAQQVKDGMNLYCCFLHILCDLHTF